MVHWLSLLSTVVILVCESVCKFISDRNPDLIGRKSELDYWNVFLIGYSSGNLCLTLIP